MQEIAKSNEVKNSFNTLSSEINAISDSLSEAYNGLPKTFLDKISEETGSINLDGSIDTSRTTWHTYTFSVSGIKNLFVSGRSYVGLCALYAFYDASFNAISVDSASETKTWVNKFVENNNAVYVKVCSSDASEQIPTVGILQESMSSFLQNKKVAIIGDSITYGTGASDDNHKYVNVFARLSGAIVKNLGIGGTCIANNTTNNLGSDRFVTRATAQNISDCDLVIVFGGTNDFSYDSKPIGTGFTEETIVSHDNIGNKQTIPTTDTDTFDGALHNLIQTIRTNSPATPIIMITPLNRGRYTSINPTSLECNVRGNYLSDFCDTMKSIGRFYSIPVLDLNSISNLDFSNPSIASEYSVDNLHPNDKGHKVIAELLYNFVKDVFVS